MRSETEAGMLNYPVAVLQGHDVERAEKGVKPAENDADQGQG